VRVHVSKIAHHDIEAIVEHIAKDSPSRAVSLAIELLDRCESLALHPERYAVAVSIGHRSIRRVPYGNYVILYSVSDDMIEVHHIVHAARDYMRSLFPGD
jgi:plasmid stabilization system protein ParE